MIKLGLNPLFPAKKLIVISDIHGMGDKLEALLAKVIPLITDLYHIVFVGDLLDHGDQPVKVLRLVRDLKARFPNQVYVVKGNHEIMLLEFMLGQIPRHRKYESWPQHGGRISLDSFRQEYGVHEKDEILAKLKEDGLWSIYEELIPYYESEKVLVSHAPLDSIIMSMFSGVDNVDKNDPIQVQSKLNGVMEKMGEEIFWKFSPEKRFYIDLGKQLICGHQFAHSSKPRLFKDRVFLDCGVGYKENRELYAIEMPDKKIISSKP